ncbi:MAG: hypothetical protein K6G24_13950 [Lachnospiraceae bacterium]|nr:hypothetical protein [Lachnospiraceae bacterium]
MPNEKTTCEMVPLENEELKKRNTIGIVIPEECGRAENYEITAIMYHDENSEEKDVEYKIYITEKDFENSTPFATIQANMNPEILLYPDEENEGTGCLEYDLVETGRIVKNEADENIIIISNIVNDSESQWIMTVTDTSAYINIPPKTIRENDNNLEIE